MTRSTGHPPDHRRFASMRDRSSGMISVYSSPPRTRSSTPESTLGLSLTPITGATALYRRLGYRQFGTWRVDDEDHGDALRFERRILFYEPSAPFPEVPYYPQTTEFTCGPASLIMAMAAVIVGPLRADRSQPVSGPSA